MPRLPPTTDQVERLIQVVQELGQHVESLYEMIDEFRLDFATLLERHAPPTPMVVNSFPRDPTAADWNERLDRYSVAADEFQDDAAEYEFCHEPVADIEPPLQPAAQQRQLWKDDTGE